MHTSELTATMCTSCTSPTQVPIKTYVSSVHKTHHCISKPQNITPIYLEAQNKILILSFYIRSYQSRYSQGLEMLDATLMCTVVSFGFQCAQLLCVCIIWDAHKLERFKRMRVEDQKLKYNLEWP